MKPAKQAASAPTTAPQAETDFEATHRDEYAGLGGEYQIRDGKRVLLHRTRTTPARSGGRRMSDPPHDLESRQAFAGDLKSSDI